MGPKLVLSDRYREVVFDDQEWHAEGDDRALGRQVRSVTVDGADGLEQVIGPGVHRVETGPSGERWRWTAGPRPFYIPLPAGADVAETTVLVDGRAAPPGPVVRLVNSAGVYLDRRGYAGDIGVGAADDNRFDEAGERFAIAGTAFVTRMSTWRRVGPFAEPFFAYYEDVDWCWRARLAGMRILYDPATAVEHKRSASSGGEHQPWVRVMAERNRTLTMVRNGPRGLVATALQDRMGQGPDGGVRAGIARTCPMGFGKPPEDGARLGTEARGGLVTVGRPRPRMAGRPGGTKRPALRAPGCRGFRGREPVRLARALDGQEVGFDQVQHVGPLVVLEHI